MDQDPFTASLFKWEYPRGSLAIAPSSTGPLQQSNGQVQSPTLPTYLARGVLGVRDPGMGNRMGMGMGMGMNMGMGMGMQGIAMGIPGGGATTNNNTPAVAGTGLGGNSGSACLEDLFQAYGIRYFYLIPRSNFCPYYCLG